ncbi:unnamed protein product [Mycena citricolor]|uniref:Uncharacterized protein n=1 Tax=Mycena citricolor TaxID=2018698 RepID=A0AAD2GYQ5_9AGAR|nr:unnamed protein product [Mycena citricolor]CAK5264849.1 unnamed protein product [Mycena citricolor]
MTVRSLCAAPGINLIATARKSLEPLEDDDAPDALQLRTFEDFAPRGLLLARDPRAKHRVHCPRGLLCVLPPSGSDTARAGDSQSLPATIAPGRKTAAFTSSTAVWVNNALTWRSYCRGLRIAHIATFLPANSYSNI